MVKFEKNKKKNKTLNKKRHYIQALGAAVVNGNFKGYFTGSLYSGPIKKVCMPVLNCYSCPGAISGCPIGSLQATMNSRAFDFPYYVLGLLSLCALSAGRFFCGYICPFGFYQDLLDKIPVHKVRVPKKINDVLKYIKYIILAVFVFILPLAMQDKYGMGSPYFCKYICPSGILVGAFPNLAHEFITKAPEDRTLVRVLGTLFFNKLTIFAIVSITSMFVYRMFCRYMCPLGAFLGIFNPISFYRMKINDKCVKCKKCEKACKFDIPTYITPNSPECIRCDECVKACPFDAIEKEFPFSVQIKKAVFKKKKQAIQSKIG